jgi:anti-sigma B factor antagonist
VQAAGYTDKYKVITERMTKMGWNITKQDKLLRVEVDGRLVAAVAPELREEILSQMEDGTNVLFDLSGMVHIDSSGLGVLVQVLQKVKAGGGKVVLASLQPGPKIVFDITKVSRVFEIVPTVADAKF